MTNPEFWMCYVEGGESPAVRHDTREEARAEAERLTRKLRRTTYVLHAESECVLAEPPIEHRELNDLPF